MATADARDGPRAGVHREPTNPTGPIPAFASRTRLMLARFAGGRAGVRAQAPTHPPTHLFSPQSPAPRPPLASRMRLMLGKVRPSAISSGVIESVHACGSEG